MVTKVIDDPVVLFQDRIVTKLIHYKAPLETLCIRKALQRDLLLPIANISCRNIAMSLEMLIQTLLMETEDRNFVKLRRPKDSSETVLATT